MGLSGGKTKTTSHETATTTPNVPDYAMRPVTGYYNAVGGIGEKLASNPSLFTTDINALQKRAYNSAGGLGGWQDGLDLSNTLGLSGALAPANTAAAPTVADAVKFGGASAGPAAQATSQGYNIANLGDAQGYSAPTLGAAGQAQASSLLDGGLDRYLNPATQALVDTTLADWDVAAGQQRAAQQAAAAKGGAFGGSRYGVAQAALEGELARGRASTDAGLRASAFDRATSLAADDANRRQQTSLFNVGEQNQFKLAQGSLDADAARFLADANNNYGLARFGAQNTANQFGANAANTNSMFNAGQKNQVNISNAANANAAGIASMNAENARNALEAQLTQQNAQFNAGQQDQALARILQGAGLLSSNANAYAANARGDVATQADIGNNYYALQDAINKGDLTNLGLYGELLNPGLLGQLTGQTIVSDGNSTSKKSGGLLGRLAGLASIAGTIK